MYGQIDNYVSKAFNASAGSFLLCWKVGAKFDFNWKIGVRATFFVVRSHFQSLKCSTKNILDKVEGVIQKPKIKIDTMFKNDSCRSKILSSWLERF